MGVASGRVGRWTRAFVGWSSISFVGLATLVAMGSNRFTLAVVGLFGFVLPMVFGMAYVLLPPYVGRTLDQPRLAGLHFGLAVVGFSGLLLWAGGVGSFGVARLGLWAWTLGVVVFVGSIGSTAARALRANPGSVLRLGDRPQRTTRLATAMLPIALAVLLLGHVVALALIDSPDAFHLAFPALVHLAGAGFAALLVFALGARLLLGFFHVDPPRSLVAVIVLPGAVGPLLLATQPTGSTWFLAGGILESAAMVAYLGLVASVAVRTDARRPGLAGILLGAVAGVAATGVALGVVRGHLPGALLDLHAVLVLQGFFGLTIAGYAFQFFPVTTGHTPGATPWGARTVIGLLAIGLALDTLGAPVTHVAGGTHAGPSVALTGARLTLAGAIGYAYLLGTRLLRDEGH